MLEKIELDEIVPSSRKYPFIEFKITKQVGKEILRVENLIKEVDGVKILNKISFTVLKGDKIAIISNNDLAKDNIIQYFSRRRKNLIKGRSYLEKQFLLLIFLKIIAIILMAIYLFLIG